MGETEFENNNFWLVGPWTTKEITGHHYEERITEKKTILFRCTKDVSDSSRTGIGVWKIERA